MFKGIAILSYPCILLWSLCYGVTGGIVFKAMALYENWLSLNRLQIMQWKRYPLRSYHKFTSTILAHRMRSRPLEMLSVTNSQVLGEYRREPFPFLALITNTLITLFIAPFVIASGAVQGPVFVYGQNVRRLQRSLSARGQAA